MAYCTNCGEEVEETAKFCTRCGFKRPSSISEAREVQKGKSCPSCGTSNKIRWSTLNRSWICDNCGHTFSTSSGFLPPKQELYRHHSVAYEKRGFPFLKVIAVFILFALIGSIVIAIMPGNNNADIPPSEDHPYWEYSNEQPPYSETQYGGQIHLINNKMATDPIWPELAEFLFADKTDEKTYDEHSFTCGAFAEEVHNNAEAAGIKAGWVAVDFEDGGIGHALNVFDVEPWGLIYIDCTSSYNSDISYITPTLYEPEPLNNFDKVAFVEEGKEYGSISLEVWNENPNTYENYKEQWGKYESAIDEYNKEVEHYNELLDEYNNLYDRCGGHADYNDECIVLGPLYDTVQKYPTRLDNQLSQINRQYEWLGDYWYEPLGIVQDIEIWW